jgi:hypothetical protein
MSFLYAKTHDIFKNWVGEIFTPNLLKIYILANECEL